MYFCLTVKKIILFANNFIDAIDLFIYLFTYIFSYWLVKPGK